MKITFHILNKETCCDDNFLGNMIINIICLLPQIKEFGFQSVSNQLFKSQLNVSFIDNILHIDKINHGRKMVSKQIILVKLAITVQYIASYVNHK